MNHNKKQRSFWPAKPPRKGSKARVALNLCLKGVSREKMLDLYRCHSNVSSWVDAMLNEKGIEIRCIKGTFIIVGFIRKCNRYRQAPGSIKRIEEAMNGQRPYSKRAA